MFSSTGAAIALVLMFLIILVTVPLAILGFVAWVMGHFFPKDRGVVEKREPRH